MYNCTTGTSIITKIPDIVIWTDFEGEWGEGEEAVLAAVSRILPYMALIV